MKKKIKIYQTRVYTKIIALENHSQATQLFQNISHHITPVIEVDRPNKENHENSHKTDIVDRIAKIINIEITIYDRIQTQHNLFLHPVPNQTREIDTIQTIDHEIHHTTEIEMIQTIEIEVIQTIEIRSIQTTDQGTTHITDQTIKELMITTKTDHKIIHKTETQAITKDTEIIPSHHIGIIAVTPILNIDTEVTHQSIKEKSIKYKQKKKNSDPPSIDETENSKLQLNHINCESTDTESDTDNTISVNMITVENDYEPIIYEQPFSSHIYENQLELLNKYYSRPINNNSQVTQKSPLSKHTKRTTERKNLDNSISLREPKK